MATFTDPGGLGAIMSHFGEVEAPSTHDMFSSLLMLTTVALVILPLQFANLSSPVSNPICVATTFTVVNISVDYFLMTG